MATIMNSVIQFMVYTFTVSIFSAASSNEILDLHLCCSTQFTFSNGQCVQPSNITQRQLFPSNMSSYIQALQSDTKENESNGTVSKPQFRFDTTWPKCSKGTRLVQVSLNGQDDVVMTTDNDNNTSQNGSNYVDGHGQIRLNGYLKYENYFYSPTEYCINGINQDENYMELVLCQKLCNSADSSCLPKCCEIDQLLRSTNFEFNCVNVGANSTWSPMLHQETHPHRELTQAEQADVEIHFVHAHPSAWCESDGFFLYQRDFPMNPKVPFKILKDGGIYYQNDVENIWEKLPQGSYCIDGIFDEDQSSHINTFDNNVIYYCPPSSLDQLEQETKPEADNQISILYYSVLIISSAFLLLTLIIHGFSLERQNIHGWTLLCFFISLFCLYVFLATLHLTRLYLDKNPTSLFCWSIGIGLHFFFLSTFSWLSVVNFDLWFTFRTLRTLIAPKSHKFKRFSVYALFALGMPIIILGIALVIDFLEINKTITIQTSINSSPFKIITPGYGQDGCFLAGREATFVYLYGPIGFLLIINLLLFIFTIVSMYKLKKTSSIATSNSNHSSHHSRQSFHLFFKLFVLMGVSWIFEVISWAANPKTIPWYWIIFDLINICQGVFIFVIFICKRSTIHWLEEKYPGFKEFIRTFCAYVNSCRCWRNFGDSRSSSLESTPQELTLRKLSDTEICSI